MQTGSRPATLADMEGTQAEPTRTVTVHLVQSPGPIRAQVACDEGAVTCFDGWLELTAAVEDARTKGRGNGSRGNTRSD